MVNQSAAFPLQRSSLVGRAAEVEAARAMLTVQYEPLLTLTGPVGVGKTRLTLAVAHAVAAYFADGVVFVDLTSIRDSVLVLPAIAQALGVGEGGDHPLGGPVAAVLESKQLLLILDNCELMLELSSAIRAVPDPARGAGMHVEPIGLFPSAGDRLGKSKCDLCPCRRPSRARPGRRAAR
jgi:hypothetical protein